MRARTARLFSTVCERYPSAVISGRAKADVARRLERGQGPLSDRQPRPRAGHAARHLRAAGRPGAPAARDRARGRPRHRHREQALLAGRALPPGPREAEGARGDPPRRGQPAGADAGDPRQAGDQRRAGSARRARATRWSRCATGPKPTSRCTSATTSPTRTSSGSISPAACSPCASAARGPRRRATTCAQQQEIDTLLEHLVALRVGAPARD